ncbi:hypothetical protein TIFTF001_055378 [Ficus carica]|uniref:Uncharacterized protein n=1 Tax=Ficus carica TaxID=3494 RepID=A0AA88EIA7_FICCA|nr:hypothetical protein TIFTF001_055378 [Ficus carica]
MVSVAHMDSPNVVDKGLNQMLSTFVNHRLEDDLDVHVIGAFDDSPPNVWAGILYFHASASSSPKSGETSDGYSRPLCSKIIRTLRKRSERFHLKTLCVLAHNTWREPEGTARPIFSGFVVSPVS